MSNRLKWLLVDGFNLAFRSFYGVPELTRSDGFPTNAIQGFLRTLWTLEDREKPDHMVVFFDLGGSAVRQSLMPDYKATRKETPDSLCQQIPWLKKIAAVHGYRVVEEQGVEADDLIASGAIQLQASGHEVLIVSSDKDLAQLIRPGIFQLLPPPTANPKLGWRLLDVDAVKQKFGVPPEKIVDYLALIGDTSDNIPGIPGVGPKKAQKWIEEYGSVEEIIKKANYIQPARFQLIIPQHIEQIAINLKMVRLQHDLKLDLLENSDPKPQELITILETMEMKRAAQETRKRFGLESV